LLGKSARELRQHAATSPDFPRGSSNHYIPDAKAPSKRNQPNVLIWAIEHSLFAPYARTALGKPFTFSRMDFSDSPLRTRPANPKNMNGTVSPRNAKNEKLVAVFFST
jgi:hypothetical protein